MEKAKNVLGTALETCSRTPLTGFFRDGSCHTGPNDVGSHTVCVQVTDEFLQITQIMGNDLSTPQPRVGFPGLKPGDRWCLCALRWQEALEAGVAPPVILRATHEAALQHVAMADLVKHAAPDDDP
jgi:uncharacterized protein (DUF2237 family)